MRVAWKKAAVGWMGVLGLFVLSAGPAVLRSADSPKARGSPEGMSQGLLTEDSRYRIGERKRFSAPVIQWIFQKNEGQKPLPKVRVQSERVQFLDARGRVKNEKALGKNDRLISSAGGRYVGSVSTLVPFGEKTDARLRLEVFTAGGDRKYTIDYRVPWDAHEPTFWISDRDGAAVEADVENYLLRFYDSQGELHATVDVFTDDEYNTERVLQGAWALDGSTLALIAMKKSAIPPTADQQGQSGEPYWLLFDAGGRELRRRALRQQYVQSVAISPEGAFIVVGTYSFGAKGQLSKSTSLFTREGVLVTEYPLLMEEAIFSPDSKVAVLAEKHLVKAVATETGVALWERLIDPARGRVVALDVSPSGEVSAILAANVQYQSGRFVFVAPSLLLVDREGKLLHEQSFPGESFVYPSLALSDDARYVVLGFQRSSVLLKADKQSTVK